MWNDGNPGVSRAQDGYSVIVFYGGSSRQLNGQNGDNFKATVAVLGTHVHFLKIRCSQIDPTNSVFPAPYWLNGSGAVVEE